MRVTNVTVREGDTLGLPPEGSPKWVRLKVEALKFHGNQARYDGERAAASARWLRAHPDAWYDPDHELRRFDSWGEFVQAVCELEAGWADFLIANEPRLTGDYQADKSAAALAVALEDKPLAKPGEVGRGRPTERVDVVNSTGGNAADYLTRRLARDRPDLIERMKAGEFRSVRQAALEAGIVKERFSVPVEVEGIAKALRRRLGPDQLAALVALLSAH